jgi:N12 class adenine-specific DNA methylase
VRLRPAHRNHPCAVWTRATRANFDSTIELAQALAAEFQIGEMLVVLNERGCVDIDAIAAKLQGN